MWCGSVLNLIDAIMMPFLCLSCVQVHSCRQYRKNIVISILEVELKIGLFFCILLRGLTVHEWKLVHLVHSIVLSSCTDPNLGSIWEVYLGFLLR